MDWFPWYPALYRADTMHLTAEQDGIYRRLIDHYMETRQPLPDNDMALARIAGVSVDAWAIAAAIIRPFFNASKSGLLHHKRCDTELCRQDGRNRIQSEKGKIGANKRWKKVKENHGVNSSSHKDPIATPMPKDSIGQDKTREEKDNTNVLSPPKGSKPYDHEFEQFWGAYRPYDMDKGSKQKARIAYDKTRKVAEHETIMRGLNQYLTYCHAKQQRTKHAVTWLNADGWADEYPDASAAGTGTAAPEGATSYERGILASLARTSGG